MIIIVIDIIPCQP